MQLSTGYRVTLGKITVNTQVLYNRGIVWSLVAHDTHERFSHGPA
jgi:hypothetical protein